MNDNVCISGKLVIQLPNTEMDNNNHYNVVVGNGAASEVVVVVADKTPTTTAAPVAPFKQPLKPTKKFIGLYKS